jgi:hypothetical protein
MTAVVQYANGSQDAVSFDYSFNLNEFVWNGVMTLAQDLRLFTIEETSKGLRSRAAATATAWVFPSAARSRWRTPAGNTTRY